MSLKNIIITSSINSLPTLSYGQKTYIPSTDYQSFSIETVTGGNGGVMPDLHGNISSSNLLININQSWSGSINTPVGIVDFIDDTQNEFINGQFSGSNILISNGELSEDNPFLKPNNIISNYITVLYFDDLSTSYPSGLPPGITPQSNFLNPNTSPDPGEIYISIISRLEYDTEYRVEYLKIATIDSNGNNNIPSLQGLQDIFIKYSNGSVRQYNITNITPYQNYYLFKVIPTPGYTSIDSKRLDYSVSASCPLQLNTAFAEIDVIQPYIVSTDVLGYLTPSTGYYTLENTPNIQLIVTASANIYSGTTSSISGYFGLVEYPSLISTGIQIGFNGVNCSIFSPFSPIITGSFAPIEGQTYALIFLNATFNHTASIYNTQFNITQSSITPPLTGSQDLVIFSPYLSEDFFYNDWNAIYGNADGLEYDSKYMKAIYEAGQSIPINQEKIISGSAERAPVKPYNYALKAQTLPRYEGVRTESPNFNATSSEGLGNVGNVESLKTVIAYSDYIGSWIPEHMDASAVHIKYLINPDSTVVIPNTSKYSLYINQDAYISGERLTLSSGDNGSISNPYRDILRGATRIEPILYNQITYSPAFFTSSINIINANAQSSATDVIRKSILNAINPSTDIAKTITNGSQAVIGLSGGQWNVYYDKVGSVVSGQTYGYYVQPVVINQNIDLTIDAGFKIRTTGNTPATAVDVSMILEGLKNGQKIIQIVNVPANSTSYTINFLADLKAGIDYDIASQFVFSISPNGGVINILEGSYWNVLQNPLPSNFAVSASSIWSFPTSASWSQQSSSEAGIIYIPDTGSALNLYYDISGIRQQNISGSGFNPITLDWSVKIGDEFRYIGREDRVFTVKKVFDPNNISSERISSIGSLEVHFTSTIPSGAYSLNEFLIRRYTDDPSLILIRGFKPLGSDGPYLAKPEFVTPNLNNNIDKILLDLTQKGLL